MSETHNKNSELVPPFRSADDAAVITRMHEYSTALSKWNHERLKNGSSSASEGVIKRVQQLYNELCKDYPHLSIKARKGVVVRPKADQHLKINTLDDFEAIHSSFMSGTAHQLISLYPITRPEDLICITYIREGDLYSRLNITTYGSGKIGKDVSRDYNDNGLVVRYADVLSETVLSSRYVECFFYVEPSNRNLHFLYAESSDPAESNIYTRALRSYYYNSRMSKQAKFKRVISKGKSELTTMMTRNNPSMYLINFESRDNIMATLIPNWGFRYRIFRVASYTDHTDACGVVRRLFIFVPKDTNDTRTMNHLATFNSLARAPMYIGDLVVYRGDQQPEVILPDAAPRIINPPKTCPSCNRDVLEINDEYLCSDRSRCPETNARRIAAFFNKFNMDEMRLEEALAAHALGLRSIVDYLSRSVDSVIEEIMSPEDATNFLRKLNGIRIYGIRFNKLMETHAYFSTVRPAYARIPELYETFQDFIENVESASHDLPDDTLILVRQERAYVMNDTSIYSSLMGIANAVVIIE